ncbi:elongation of very long chain fatty acid james bond protein [Megalopta genalis]|uniref:elongation of very long chain fatty acid james bond protein n=1 Tax=Megalopta genalis TaxID=115081 RepID=UPI0014433B14|nr:elongation of very long chain fatty acids protein AAEL008004-like [Megalopta genalis]
MASIIHQIISNYDEIEEINSEIKVPTWPLMGSPGPMLTIVGCYLAFILKVGPRMMEKKPAYQLSNVMIAYNAVQVALSFFLVMRVFQPGIIGVILSPRCGKSQHAKLDMPLQLAVSTTAWWYHIAKMVELLDTVFFVLRKKQNQITFLHIYHHTMTAVVSWIYVRLLPGEQCVLLGLLNSFVHVVMYTYYLLTALGPQYQKYLWWKKYITWLQLVQFAIVLSYLFMVLVRDCQTPKPLTYFMMANMIIFLYLFGDFYRKAYKPKKV